MEATPKAKAKSLLKEVIEFYEACGRDRRKTKHHFFQAKKASKGTVSNLISKYEKEGPSILEEKKKTPKSEGKFRRRKSLEKAKWVAELLKEDPSVTCAEGAQLLGMSRSGFSMYKSALLALSPEKMTTEEKIQLGFMPPPVTPEHGQMMPLEVHLEELNVGQPNLNSPSSAFITPRAKRRRLFRQRHHHCLLCFIRVDSNFQMNSISNKEMNWSQTQNENPSIPIPVSPMANDSDNDSGELGENLNVIFALKNILDLDSSDLIKFMEASKGKDPRGWYHLCNECDGMMKEAVAIQHQILQLTRDLEKCKSRIQGKIESSLENESGELDCPDDDDHDDDELVVTNLIRDSVCPWDRIITPYNFGKVVVKIEPITIDEDDFGVSNNFEDPVDPIVNEDIEVKTEADTEGYGQEGVNLSVMEMDQREGTSSNANILQECFGNLNASSTTLKVQPQPKLVTCDACGDEMRLFSLPVHALRVHGVLMEGYTEFKCPEDGCQYKTVYKFNFDDHKKKVHVPMNERKYTCQFCGKKFKNKDQLRKHEIWHTNKETKPYKCHVCGRGFAVYSTLWNHVKRVHTCVTSSPKRQSRLPQKKKGSKKLDESLGTEQSRSRKRGRFKAPL